MDEDTTPKRQPEGNLRQAALRYARAGVPVFPLWPRAKEPLTAHGFKDATTDPDAIASWWRDHPVANIGVPTGIRFDVLDLDTADAIEWAEQRGLPAGPRVRTGRGIHVYLQPTGAGNRTGLHAGADYKAERGYVLVPPSLHASGRTYAYVPGQPKTIPAAPTWLRELLAPPRNREIARPDRVTVSSVASLRTMAERLAARHEGDRNWYLYWCARGAADTGIAQADVAVVLRDAAQRAGLGDHEITNTLRSAFKRWS